MSMRLLNRKKPTNNEAINDYYVQEQRRRVGVAWLLGFATLVLTIILALALFYGGRWAYRTVFDNDDTQPKPTADQTASNTDQDENSEGSLNTAVDDDPAESNGTANTNRSSGADELGEAAGGNSPGDAGNNEATDERSLPSSGPSLEELPSTGPSEPEL